MESRNFGAEMAAYLERGMSAALKLSPVQDTNSLIAMLAALIREGVSGALEAMCQQLRPLLINLAKELQPEDPHDLVTALYYAVLRKKDIISYLEKDIRSTYKSEWRTKKRDRRKKAALTLAQQAEPIHEEPVVAGEVSILLKYLTPEERYLWVETSRDIPLTTIAEELGWSYETTKKRWQELVERLKATLETEPK